MFFSEEHKISASEYKINNQIRAKSVRLIGPDGNNIGVVPIEEALEVARTADLDLVEIAPNADPPVCRVLDFGKFLYEKSKKDREARKAQTKVEIKESRKWSDKPKIVLVIDDIGHHIQFQKELENLGSNVTYAILPLFALANAGIYFGDITLKDFINPLALGVGLGLFQRRWLYYNFFLLLQCLLVFQLVRFFC